MICSLKDEGQRTDASLCPPSFVLGHHLLLCKYTITNGRFDQWPALSYNQVKRKT